MEPLGTGPGSKPRARPRRFASRKSDPFKGGVPPEDQSSYNMEPSGPGPGSEPRPTPVPSPDSVKSDRSKSAIIHFKEASADDRSNESDDFKDWPSEFEEFPTEEKREHGPKEQLDDIFTRLEEDVLTFVKEQVQRLHRLLVSWYPESSFKTEGEQSSREAVLNITLDFLRRMKQEELAERLSCRSSVEVCRDKLKWHLQRKFSNVFEGVAKAGSSTPLHQIYTELYITKGGTSEVNQEHEVRHIETVSRKPASTETRITCEDLFKSPTYRQQPIRAEQTEEGPIITGQTEEGASKLKKRKRSMKVDQMKHKKSKETDQKIETIREELTEEEQMRAEQTGEEPLRAEQTGEEPVRAEQTGEGPIRAEQTAEETMRAEQTGEEPMRAEQTGEGPIRAEQTGEEPIRTVLTKGVAGVGKTVLTQKFSLDWAEGKANQEVQLLFPFTFRELNVLKDKEFSLMELLHHFFNETKGLCSFHQVQVIFIFDGLDECRLSLDFSRTRTLTEPTESASVEELLVNLIRGDLLPSAHLWITTRPAAANQIPAECVSMVTEVRGFSDSQKEEYFGKRFKDKATTIISHIKRIHSLYIMCHIPVFCWILSTVLLFVMETSKKQELPHTLTQMYIHLLVVQAKVTNIKYHEGSGTELHWTPETSKMVQSLGKLAFQQLQKGNLIFYESDLSECGLDATAASVYSGVFTQVFREESGLYQDKVYCFIHLSVQEFMAALHVHQTFFSSGENLLSTPHSSESPETFYRCAVDQALQSPNGHLDMFLRFLLGLSLPTNQSLLSGHLTPGSDSTNQETVKYIKEKLDEKSLSAERSLNLLHCLNELNDRTLMEDIQRHMREGELSVLYSPALWSALSFLLLSSDSDLEEFDLRKYQASETVLLKLLPVVKASTKAILSFCGLSSLGCGPLASVLSSTNLTHLDLSNNDLQDSGVELLCSGLKSNPCRLHSLKLSGCLVSEKGGASLAGALSSGNSHLRHLDLSYNHPGPSTELLTALRAPHGPLDSLRLDPAGKQWMVPGLRKYYCEFSLDPNTAQMNLLLSENKRTVTRVREEQQYPDRTERFTEQSQVLSSTGLTGRCYWELQWSAKFQVDAAVSYRRLKQRGRRAPYRFGDNDQSWSLSIHKGWYAVWHKNRQTILSSSSFSFSDVVGVFLDSEAGTLSFYEVLSGGELFHIYTFTSSFNEALFPGFHLMEEGSSMSLVDLSRVPRWTPVTELELELHA